VIAVLEQLGALRPDERAALEPLRRPQVVNAAGAVVGHLEASLREGVPA
jgi:hypothetical protein